MDGISAWDGACGVMLTTATLRIKSQYLGNPRSDSNTVIWLQRHMRICLKSIVWLINQFCTVRSICLIIIDIFCVLSLQLGGAQHHLSTFAGLRLT